MDERTRFMRALRGELGNLLGNARIKVVTVASVDAPNRVAVVNFAQPDPSQTAPDPQTVPYLGHYRPEAGDLAFLALIEGAPTLLGSVFSGPLGHADLYTNGLSGVVNATSFTTVPGTATTPTFTKLKNGTRLKVALSVTCFVTVASTQVEFAALINGTDYGPAAGQFINPASAHTNMSGFTYVDGLPAGDYTATIRARRTSGTGVITFNAGDPAWVSVDETW